MKKKELETRLRLLEKQMARIHELLSDENISYGSAASGEHSASYVIGYCQGLSSPKVLQILFGIEEDE